MNILNIYIDAMSRSFMNRSGWVVPGVIILLAVAVFAFGVSFSGIAIATPPNADSLDGVSDEESDSSCALGIGTGSTRNAFGNLGGGCKCESDSDCKSGECDCKTTGSQNRCCNNDAGEDCSTHSDCQSNNCNPNTHKCAVRGDGNDSRPPGMACDVNEDCNSGYCDKRADGNGNECR